MPSFFRTFAVVSGGHGGGRGNAVNRHRGRAGSGGSASDIGGSRRGFLIGEVNVEVHLANEDIPAGLARKKKLFLDTP